MPPRTALDWPACSRLVPLYSVMPSQLHGHLPAGGHHGYLSATHCEKVRMFSDFLKYVNILAGPCGSALSTYGYNTGGPWLIHEQLGLLVGRCGTRCSPLWLPMAHAPPSVYIYVVRLCTRRDHKQLSNTGVTCRQFPIQKLHSSNSSSRRHAALSCSSPTCSTLLFLRKSLLQTHSSMQSL